MSRPSDELKPAPLIVVLEEAVDDIYSIKFVLQSLGYEAEAVAYGDGYIEELTRLVPKIVIVDMLIPVRGGFEAVRQLRQISKRLPIVTITADAMDGDEKELKKAGASALVKKPYSVPELNKVLMKLLASS